MAVERIAILSEDSRTVYLALEVIIRCRDCKHYIKKLGWCVRNGIQPVKETDFCSKAERKN